MDYYQIKIPKPHIRFPLKIMLAVSICLAVFFAGTTVYYFSMSKDLNTEMDRLNEQSDRKTKTMQTLISEKTKLEKKSINAVIGLGFYFDSACIVTTTGEKYHRLGCGHIKDNPFWIYNVEAAEQKGYEPCLDCWTDSYLADYLSK